MKSSNFNITDLPINQIFYISTKNNCYITKGTGTKLCGDRINIGKSYFEKYPDSTNSSWFVDSIWTIRKATPEEQEWLNICIEDGLYSDKPKYSYNIF